MPKTQKPANELKGFGVVFHLADKAPIDLYFVNFEVA